MAAATELSITGVERTEFGKGPSRRSRQAGNIPAVLYGHSIDPVHLDLPGHAVFLIVKDNANAVLTVNYGKKKQLALVKSIQRHPVRRDILHVDLLAVRADEKVEVEVPIVIVGEPISGTQLAQEEFAVLVKAPATSIPESIEVDVEGLEEGVVIRVENLVLPEGVETMLDGEREIVAVQTIQDVAIESAETAVEEAVEEAAKDAE
ncbi:50S ribosomal protein L25/general stress protein Ctc [Actinomycetaceae bacterium MB13-C1-2]|nr:50S ribosomal protein L25/general stress protein Ctc [Actinomycetaceae bacterium MB13-C1-2]